MQQPSDALQHWNSFATKMELAGLAPAVIETFYIYYQMVVKGESGLISNQEIQAVPSDEVKDIETLAGYRENGHKAMPHFVMIVLNGGLGTSMGLQTAKSLLPVKHGRSFLDLIVNQAQKANIHLAIMNSFSTDLDTRAALDRAEPIRAPLLFLQNKFPKILRNGFAPASWPANPALEWNPPGHGDIYIALHTSGTLKRLLEDGVRYAMICNSDNLGATADPDLLGYFAAENLPFMMEVAERTPADMKGGHLARHKNGRLLLREIAQCPETDLDAFKDIKQFHFFNTNNLWVNLEQLENQIKLHGTVRLPLILNPKTLDPRDNSSPPVFQVESAMGAAIALFDNAAAVKTRPSRFYPVKKCNELLALRSDCFVLDEHGCLVQNPDRKLNRIKIDLDPDYYSLIDSFNQRFSAGVPSLLECENLTIKGDVIFEEGVTIKGRVIIQNQGSSQAVIPARTVVDRDIVL
jgi:UTP--glucose-1-phosphate uridylyltransferase